MMSMQMLGGMKLVLYVGYQLLLNTARVMN